eukprot:SAG22_NODE_1129_length_5458_cov_33.388692_4_plen_231_part_00
MFDKTLDRWIFKEFIGQRTAVHGKEQDRWHNSGGKKAARDLPKTGPVVRRRCGSIKRPKKAAAAAAGAAALGGSGEIPGATHRYHEYSLTVIASDGSVVDDGGTRLYHVVQKDPVVPIEVTQRLDIGPGGVLFKHEGEAPQAESPPSPLRQSGSSQPQHRLGGWQQLQQQRQQQMAHISSQPDEGRGRFGIVSSMVPIHLGFEAAIAGKYWTGTGPHFAAPCMQGESSES